MRSRIHHALAILFLLPCGRELAAQSDTLPPPDELRMLEEQVEEGTAPMETYEPLNGALGGDSLRLCSGYACTGWVEDRYGDGQLMHRGYYKDGQLLVYRNYFANGKLEREFKVVDNTRCSMRTYHDNGAVRTEVNYVDGEARTFKDYYANGRLRYAEEKHAKLPCYTVMDLFAHDGTPISTLRLADKKQVIFEQKEYWPGGSMRCSGRSQFNPQRYDSQRIGEWTYYDENGRPVRAERYVDGKVHEVADL